MNTTFLTLGKERQLPQPAWWIEDFLVQGSVTMMSAQPKTGKSAFAAHLAHAVATGAPFFGRDVPQGTVLYLAGERGHQTEDRLLDLFGEDGPINTVLMVPTLSDLGAIKFNLKGDPERLVKALQQHSLHPSLIIVDTLSNFYHGSQNDEDLMGGFFDGLRWACEQFNAAGFVLHHDNKEYVDRYNRRSGGTSYRGSGAALARVDSYIRARVDKELPDPDDPRGERTIKIVEIELAEDNWGGSFKQTVAVRKVLEDADLYLHGQDDVDAMVELVIEVIEQEGEISVKRLQKRINDMNDPRMRGRQFNRQRLKEVRDEVGDLINERPDPNDGRGKLLYLNPERLDNAV